MPELQWLKSSFSEEDGNNCVEVAATDDRRVALRESEDPGRVLTPTAGAFRALLGAVKAAPGSGGSPA